METQLKNDGEYQNFSEFGGYFLMTKLFNETEDDIDYLTYKIFDFCINELNIDRMDGKKVFVHIYGQWDTENHAFIGDNKNGRYLFSITRCEAGRRLEELQKYMDSWEYPMTIRDIDIASSWNGDDFDDEVISFKIYDKSKSKIYRTFEQLWKRFSHTRIYSNIKELLKQLGIKRKSWLHFR